MFTAVCLLQYDPKYRLGMIYREGPLSMSNLLLNAQHYKTDISKHLTQEPALFLSLLRGRFSEARIR